MSSDLPDRLLGLGMGESDDRQRDDEQEEYERFVIFELGERRLALAVDDVRAITDPPSELTRVPRSPRTVGGVTDLRGEITAVIDLRLHFPTENAPSDEQRLIVFETAPDQQPAAVRVDHVRGVESVPERNVVRAADLEGNALEDASFDPGDVDESVLEHPLIVAAVVTESGVELGIDDLLPGRGGGADDDPASEMDSLGGVIDRDDVDVGELFDEEDDVDPAQAVADSLEGSHEIETTGLLDVGRLLLSSGPARQ